MDENKLKLGVQLTYGFIALLAGIYLLIASMYIEPKGIIDNSILVGAGQLFVFTGTCMGLNVHFKNKYLKANDK